MRLKQRPYCLSTMTLTSATMKSCLGFGEGQIFKHFSVKVRKTNLNLSADREEKLYETVRAS